MKNIILIAICICFSRSLNAQIRPAIKQTPIIKTDTNHVINQQTTAVSTIKRILPTTLNESLLFYKWKASRESVLGPWENVTYSSPNITFYNNGTVSGSNNIATLNGNQLMNGTYTVSGNNIAIKFKIDTTATFDCYLTFDKITKSFTGPYIYNVLKGYAAGRSVQGEMKMEINPL